MFHQGLFHKIAHIYIIIIYSIMGVKQEKRGEEANLSLRYCTEFFVLYKRLSNSLCQNLEV